MNNAFRLLSMMIYPLFVLAMLFYVIRSRYLDTFKKNFKNILINLIIVLLVGIVGILIFFHFEKDAVYVYDNAGYYIKSLEMLQIFWQEPSNLFPKVFNTINNSDYSYLPSLFNFYGLMINNSYAFYCVINFVVFLVPTIVLLLMVYYKKFNNKLVPVFVFIGFYPLWLTLFYGRVDCLGLFPLLIFYIFILFTDFEKINWLDTLILNILTLLLMFERRWYLYALVGAYLAYLIKAIYNAFQNKKYLNNAIKFVLSGLLALVILLVFFNGFVQNVMLTNNTEAYAYYNHSGKLLAVVNFYSIIVCIVSLFGVIKLSKTNNLLSIELLVMLIIPTLMFWMTQSFDLHHYLIICLPILFLFVYGIENITNKYIGVVIVLLLIVQSLFIFIPTRIPGFTNVKRLFNSNPYKEGLYDVADYLCGISKDEGIYTYVATGDNDFCDDAIRNVLLPSVDFPNMVSYIFDIRDGFPRDFGNIKYFVLSEPILYLNEDYQHMYKVISDAIMSMSTNFKKINEFELSNHTKIYVYEQVGEYTSEMKEYFYDKMSEFYPDKADYFSYILQ
ncbi:MAG: hypothetical protein PT938_03160 [Solobacterium sp.]|nr:hypothetical protein [Solobacterium sp.]MDY2952099.1 hypothetical protein [Erysipelotrichaceae bacterium]